MSGFDQRWLRLVEAARSGEPPAGSGPEGAPQSERLALLGVAFAQEQQRARREARGLALAASIFLAFVCAAGALADSIGWSVRVQDARDLAQVARHLPPPSFVPPPRAAGLDSLAPGRALDALEHWWLAADLAEEL